MRWKNVHGKLECKMTSGSFLRCLKEDLNPGPYKNDMNTFPELSSPQSFYVSELQHLEGPRPSLEFSGPRQINQAFEVIRWHPPNKYSAIRTKDYLFYWRPILLKAFINLGICGALRQESDRKEEIFWVKWNITAKNYFNFSIKKILYTKLKR